jgi:hypothetical protein
MFVSCLYVVLSCIGRGLFDGLISHPGEFSCASNCVLNNFLFHCLIFSWLQYNPLVPTTFVNPDFLFFSGYICNLFNDGASSSDCIQLLYGINNEIDRTRKVQSASNEYTIQSFALSLLGCVNKVIKILVSLKSGIFLQNEEVSPLINFSS